MGEQRFNASAEQLRIVEQAYLLQDERSVVVDALAGEFAGVIEFEHAAKRKRHGATSRRQTAPRTIMRAANLDFNYDGIFGSDAFVDLNM